MLVIVVEFKKLYFVVTIRTLHRVISKRRKNSSTPLIETTKKVMLFFRNSTMQMFVNFTMAGIDTTISNHFEVLFRDMPD